MPEAAAQLVQENKGRKTQAYEILIGQIDAGL